MKLLLKDFQTETVDQLMGRLWGAADDIKKDELQSVCLSAPTGSGKTIMITAAIERILQGDDDHPPEPNATFLWVTDQPELNEQTRRKMLVASSILTNAHLIVIDSAFDRETLKPGCIHFLNIQKLGKEKDLVTPGDERTYTIWETITNTINSRPRNFFVIIDEAHRGMTESQKARNEATTIIQKFIKGSAGEIPSVPLIVGISATPERFNKLIEGTGRTARSVNVKPDDVRASGLLKEVITLYHPREDQPSDMTMLRAAVRSRQKFTEHWKDYYQTQGNTLVEPILVVQVQDGAKNQLSKTNLGEAIRVILDEIGPLPQTGLAHSFQEGGRVQVGDVELRYLAPADIDSDPDVRVIFFKTSLNTGWDCPRAEVMMSFRTALDATLIAQLVGRMVRTPLARRVDADEFLNTVALYLPHYDELGLKKVIDRLTEPDAEIMPPVMVEKGEDIVTLTRAKDSDGIFAALTKLPSCVIPRSRSSSQVRRLMKLSRLLAHDEIDDDAPEKATKKLLNVLRTEYDRAKRSKKFKTVVEKKGKLKVRGVNWQVGTDVTRETGTIEIDIAAENVEDLFDAVGRRLGEGLHKAWWRSRVEKDPSAKERAKLELFALCLESTVLEKVESTAQQTVQKWLKAQGAEIAALAEGRRQGYDEVRARATEPELSPLVYPTTIEGKKAADPWNKHLFVGEGSIYAAKFNKWEKQVLEEELGRKDVVAWLRNLERKPWALCVPYQRGGEWHPMYPDFLIVRSVAHGIKIDLLDPHSPELADAPAKASGLAQYAAKHAVEFGRIDLIMIDKGRIRRLDLTDEVVRNRVKAVTTDQHLLQLFDLG